ncbi:unnamed protein product [Chondrus crispus]|uniref:CAP-Gly domain-containing protein n=1 Tax=Chondrus crispus TaxID=2769 RepID=R7QQA3_CHOCR|nr:unnamed protein product [Chondrus crispus]CDF39661.1 unnamed protein product [Chondrus crispus]|eukprot:XP_005709955.1 unnamed protein product [Chondrus crispus]
MPSPGSYETPTTPGAVRSYVLGRSSGQAQAASTVLLNVNHSNLKTTRFLELRMDLSASISAVKDRLYLHTGTRPASMTLLLRSSERGPIRAELADEARTLADYAVATGDWLHLVDDDPHSASAGGWLEDTSLAPKYELPEGKYESSENTYRAYKARMREKDPKWSMTSELAKKMNKRNTDHVDLAEERPEVEVGRRVEVVPGGKRGEVMFVGRDLEGLPEGWWLGIRFDEPVGRNDGSVKGVRYFEADMGFGGLVRPSRVTVGDFPPLDDVDEGSEDEI